jgi:archaellum component FlaC
MAREPDSLVLEYLRRLDAGMQLLREDVGDLKRRMTGVEEGLAGVNRRLDRLDERAGRIERRLDLAEV